MTSPLSRALRFLIPILLFIVGIVVVMSDRTSAQSQLPVDLSLPPPDRCHSLGAAGTPYVRGINCRLILVDEYPRVYIVFVPPTVQDPAPVVFMFHGSSGDGYQYLQISGWREKARSEGLITVFPPFETVEGTHYTTFRWQTNRRGESDHVFQLALLEGLEHKYPNSCHSTRLWPF